MKTLHRLPAPVLFALAATGGTASTAQAETAIYGLLDLGFAHMSGASTKRNLNVIDSLWLPPRLGFRGSEDLGNGAKALYTLEYNIAPDQNSGIGDAASRTAWTGTQTRQAHVGLAGRLGTLTMGRLHSAGLDFACTYSPVAGGAFNTTERLGASYFLFCGTPGRLENALAWQSPEFAGLSLTWNHARVTEGGTLTGSDATANLLALNYRNGPLQAGGVFARLKRGDTPADDDVREWGLGATYDLDAAKAYALYQTRQTGNASPDRKWSLGLGIPVGSAGQIRLSWGTNRLDSTPAQDNARAWTLGYGHDLSKRSTLYVGYSKVTNDPAGTASVNANYLPATPGGSSRIIGAGMVHRF